MRPRGLCDGDRGAVLLDEVPARSEAALRLPYLSTSAVSAADTCGEASLSGLVTKRHAFVVRTSSMEIFDVRKGKLLGTVGSETYD